MKYEDIKNEISQSVFKQIYLLYGDDEFLKNSVYNVIKSNLLKKNNSKLDELKYNDESDIFDILNECNTYAFTGNAKLIKCKNTNFFSKEEYTEPLTRIVNDISDNTFIIFIETNISKKLTSFKNFNKSGYAYDISKGKPDDVKKFIYLSFKREGKTISSSDLDLFIEFSGLNLAYISLNIDKILLYMNDQKNVTSDMIKLLCNGITDVKSYELCSYLCKKDLKNTLNVYYDMIALKYSIPYFLAILFNTFYELYNIKISNTLKSDDFRKRIAIDNASKFSLEALNTIIKDICDFDHDFKTGKINQDSLMIILFSKIVNS